MNLKRAVSWLLIGIWLPLAGEDVTVLFVSDTHAQMDSWRRLAGLIERERALAGKENTLLVDSGDTLRGSYPGSFRNGEIPLAVTNLLRFDIWVPGNHDFECMPFRFGEFRGTVLGGNWRCRDFKPEAWRMFRRGGHRIAVAGVGEAGLEQRILPDCGVTFVPEDAVLDRAAEEALAAGAELLILVLHDGQYGKRGALGNFLRRHPEFLLVIGAHTHEKVPGKKIGNAWYVQAGSHGEVLGKALVHFPDKGVPEIQSELLETQEAPEYRFPPEITSMLREVRREGTRSAGRTAERLASPSCGDFRGKLGDLAGKAILEETHAEAAIFSGSQGNFSCGPELTQKDLFRLLPFENELCTVRLTPEELEETVRYYLQLRRRKKYLAVRFEGIQVKESRPDGKEKIILPQPGRDGRIPAAFCDYDLAGGGDVRNPLARFIRQGKSFRRTDIRIRSAVLRRLAGSADQ